MARNAALTCCALMRAAAPLAVAGLCLAAPAGVSAQELASTDAAAEVVDNVTLIKTRDMDFGRIIVPRAGRIDMTATQTATCTPNNGLLPLDACQSAAFEGSGGNGFQIRVRVPANRRINLTGPGRDLRLRQMSVGAGDGLTFIRRVNRNFDFEIVDPGGAFEFFVGGRLLLRNNQASGLYTGSFDIDVDYE